MAQRPSIAVLGATSRIARDVLPLLQDGAEMDLFGRSGATRPYDEFSGGDYTAVINFVGAGDPARARDMGEEILSVTSRYDQLALEYLQRRPDTRYIFLSSGAAYGGNFQEPAHDGGESPLLNSDDHYGAAKQEAEARHRLSAHTIFDLRVFNYVARTMDVSSRFLLAQMVQAARTGTVFHTMDRPMTRDFLHLADLAQMIKCCLGAQGNMALDCYSRAPVTKHQLLDVMAGFGMRYEFTPEPVSHNVTGEKPHYYSRSRRAAALGYVPAWSSADAIRSEVAAILSQGS